MNMHWLLWLKANKLLLTKCLLLLALLTLHFETRRQTARTMSAEPEFYRYSHCYPQCYRVSLSLLAGKGFRRISLPDVPGANPLTESQIIRAGKAGDSPPRLNDNPDAASALPLVAFLNLSQQTVSKHEFRAYLDSPYAQTEPCDTWETGRVLDIYATALAWKLFGISWTVLHVCNALASTLACLGIFLIARQLSGSYWAGLLAALVFLASPFENQFAIRSVRDISPLWFGILAFAFFVCCVDNARTRWWNVASFIALGALAVVGRGWRSDVLVLVPFLLAGLFLLLLRRHGWKYACAGCALYLAGAWATNAGIGALCPVVPQSAQTGFHIAYYGDASRCNLLGLENSLQVPRDDLQTYLNACSFHEARQPDEPGLEMLSPAYGAACRDMYVQVLKYHLFDYVLNWPRFFLQALAAFSEPGYLQGESQTQLDASRLPWALPIYRFALDRMTKLLPYLFGLGAVTLFLIGRDRLRGGCVALFALYYGGILFAVLPEQKHFGQLLLPLSVMGGLGLWGLARLLGFLYLRADCRELTVVLPRSLRLAAWLGLAAVALWGLALVASYPLSLRQRQQYLREFSQRAEHGRDAPETLRDGHTFSVVLKPEDRAPARGYRLTIAASATPGYLVCKHVRPPQGVMPGRMLVTRHKLTPGQVQHFCVSCQQRADDDPRSYACTVTLEGGAEIKTVTEFDLGGWKMLSFSTIYHDGERTPGSPWVGRYAGNEPEDDPNADRYIFNNLSSRMIYTYPWQTLQLAIPGLAARR